MDAWRRCTERLATDVDDFLQALRPDSGSRDKVTHPTLNDIQAHCARKEHCSAGDPLSILLEELREALERDRQRTRDHDPILRAGAFCFGVFPAQPPLRTHRPPRSDRTRATESAQEAAVCAISIAAALLTELSAPGAR